MPEKSNLNPALRHQPWLQLSARFSMSHFRYPQEYETIVFRCIRSADLARQCRSHPPTLLVYPKKTPAKIKNPQPAITDLRAMQHCYRLHMNTSSILENKFQPSISVDSNLFNYDYPQLLIELLNHKRSGFDFPNKPFQCQ